MLGNGPIMSNTNQEAAAKIEAASFPEHLSGSSSSQQQSFSSSDIYTEPPLKKPKLTQIISAQVASALDRTKTSHRNAVYILASTAGALGHDSSNIAITKDSIRRKRTTRRSTLAKETYDSFSSKGPLVVHWDGNMMCDVTSNESNDRLAVVVSGEGISKLLGVPKIPDGTGESQAKAVYATLQHWDLTTRI